MVHADLMKDASLSSPEKKQKNIMYKIQQKPWTDQWLYTITTYTHSFLHKKMHSNRYTDLNFDFEIF